MQITHFNLYANLPNIITNTPFCKKCIQIVAVNLHTLFQDNVRNILFLMFCLHILMIHFAYNFPKLNL